MDEQRLQEIRDDRDPILLTIHKDTEKTRKWVVFIGVVVIISLVIGVAAWMLSAMELASSM